MLETLYKEALDRKKNPKEGSYTNYLFDKGLDKILKKGLALKTLKPYLRHDKASKAMFMTEKK